MNEIDRIVELLGKYTDKSLTSEERIELEDYLRKYPFISDLLQEFDSSEQLEKALKEIAPFYLENVVERENRMWDRVKAHAESQADGNTKKLDRHFWKYAVAASLLVLSTFAFYVFQWKNTPYAQQALADGTEHLIPGTNRAVLVMEGGERIELSDKHEGIVMGREIVYTDGSLLAHESGSMASNRDFVLSTPKGGQYQITLPDGSKVWLNAESNITYPAKFAGAQRLVKLEGEAYFEVARNPAQPFVVETGRERVKVLGTHFNVNSYKDVEQSAVSLAEGRVSVSMLSKSAEEKVLSPGQQAVVRNNRMDVRNVDIGESLAWKNGEFMFNNESLSEVMQTLSRWYDFEYEIAPEIAKISVWGSVSRYDTFDKVLHIIKMTDESIKIAIHGRRVTVMK